MCLVFMWLFGGLCGCCGFVALQFVSTDCVYELVLVISVLFSFDFGLFGIDCLVTCLLVILWVLAL